MQKLKLTMLGGGSLYFESVMAEIASRRSHRRKNK